MDFVNIKAQYQAYKKDIDVAIERVLATGEFIGGDEIERLEIELAFLCGAKHAICCSSGTDALLLALLAAKIKPSDEVIIPSFTFVATAETLVLLGAKPVFVDIEPATGLLDKTLIEAAINSSTRAIIPVSLFGQTADMDEIQTIAHGYNLVVIEDGAQSFGANYKERFSGNLSDYGCTSFYPTKPLGCYGDGGALFTNDERMAKKIKCLLNHGQTKKYEYEYIGINGRLDSLQAAILRVKLKHLEEEIERRRELAAAYDEVLASTSITPLKVEPENQSIYAQYSVYAADGSRDDIRHKLAALGIPTAIYYPKPLHLHRAYAPYKKSLPHSEQASKQIFSLPIHAFLTEDEKEKIIDGLKTLV